jgi:hypothetical protein
MKKAIQHLKVLGLLIPVFFFCACNPIADDTQSSTLLVVMNMLGTTMEGGIVNFLESDVLRVDPRTLSESIVADTATATLRASLLAPSPVNPASEYNNIQLTRYVVSYWRSDGRNTEGVDIPYSFEGYLSTVCEVDISQDISFVIVRAVAKAEPPLINLREGRGEGVIEVQAKVEFYGHDMTNKTVKATGYLTIFFANYADPGEEDEGEGYRK